jgi:hypothetical protein
MKQTKEKTVKSLQDLMTSCKRNGQVFNLREVEIKACNRDCTSGGCYGHIFSKP